MQLKYRGVTYDYNPPAIEVTEEVVGGKYRGLDWRFRNLKKPPVQQPILDLKYRGVAYRTNVQAETVGTTQSNVLTPVLQLSTDQKARVLMLDHERESRNRQQTMLWRSAAEVGLDVGHAH